MLRCVKSGFGNVTHLILDEVHESELNTDLLQIFIRDAIAENPSLKIILMSATLNAPTFRQYFGNGEIINVPGRLFEVEVFYLEKILTTTKYLSQEMKDYIENHGDSTIQCIDMATEIEVSNEDAKFYEECLDECLTSNDISPFDQILYLIKDENIPVDFVHKVKNRTALGVAAEKGFTDVVKQLLTLNANPMFTDHHGKNAFDYAKINGHGDCYNALAYQMEQLENLTSLAYQSTINPKKPNAIDHQLLEHLILHIHTTANRAESILVFLPGIQDIVMQKEHIEKMFSRNGIQNFCLFLLHSSVEVESKVFRRMSQGIRKIILSTNIAETSLTINDVVS